MCTPDAAKMRLPRATRAIAYSANLGCLASLNVIGRQLYRACPAPPTEPIQQSPPRRPLRRIGSAYRTDGPRAGAGHGLRIPPRTTKGVKAGRIASRVLACTSPEVEMLLVTPVSIRIACKFAASEVRKTSRHIAWSPLSDRPAASAGNRRPRHCLSRPAETRPSAGTFR